MTHAGLFPTCLPPPSSSPLRPHTPPPPCLPHLRKRDLLSLAIVVTDAISSRPPHPLRIPCDTEATQAPLPPPPPPASLTCANVTSPPLRMWSFRSCQEAVGGNPEISTRYPVRYLEAGLLGPIASLRPPPREPRSSYLHSTAQHNTPQHGTVKHTERRLLTGKATTGSHPYTKHTNAFCFCKCVRESVWVGECGLYRTAVSGGLCCSSYMATGSLHHPCPAARRDTVSVRINWNTLEQCKCDPVTYRFSSFVVAHTLGRHCWCRLFLDTFTCRMLHMLQQHTVARVHIVTTTRSQACCCFKQQQRTRPKQQKSCPHRLHAAVCPVPLSISPQLLPGKQKR